MILVYLSHESQKLLPVEIKKISSHIITSDVNTHHSLSGSSNINKRGELNLYNQTHTAKQGDGMVVSFKRSLRTQNNREKLEKNVSLYNLSIENNANSTQSTQFYI